MSFSFLCNIQRFLDWKKTNVSVFVFIVVSFLLTTLKQLSCFKFLTSVFISFLKMELCMQWSAELIEHFKSTPRLYLCIYSSCPDSEFFKSQSFLGVSVGNTLLIQDIVTISPLVLEIYFYPTRIALTRPRRLLSGSLPTHILSPQFIITLDAGELFWL